MPLVVRKKYQIQVKSSQANFISDIRIYSDKKYSFP